MINYNIITIIAPHVQQIVTFHKEEALLSINGSSSVQLRSLLEGVCDLVSVYELISKVDKSSDLQIILTQSIMDSCNWVTDNYYYCMFYTEMNIIIVCSNSAVSSIIQYMLSV